MTHEQFVRRIMVVCAREMGQRIEVIAQTSFAVLLWTYYELQEMKAQEAVERLGERTDMAGMVAVAFHQPQDLQKMEMRYLRAAGKLSSMIDDARDRIARMVEAHRHVQPVMRDATND
jgi:hypothetical protein